MKYFYPNNQEDVCLVLSTFCILSNLIVAVLYTKELLITTFCSNFMNNET